MANARSNKLYIIVDPEEGVLFVNMDRKGSGRKLTGAVHSVADIKANLDAHALKAIGFATDFDRHPDKGLRAQLESAYRAFAPSGSDGAMFAIGVDQSAATLLSSNRSSDYAQINPALTDLFGKEKA